MIAPGKEEGPRERTASAAASEPQTIGSPRVCVLLVEDELLIRSIMAESLNDAGFDVLHAGTGDEALALLERASAPISLLVTDIHLPGGKSGLDVARIMRDRQGSLPVIVATGRPDVFGVEWRRAERVVLLRKPYGPGELVATVQRMLREADEPGASPLDPTKGSRP